MIHPEPATRPELWGGVECTVNRVGDRYHDQLRRSRHLERLQDVDRFAALGLKALRVPLLWERSCAQSASPSFEWVQPLLARVEQNGLRAIAGLVHHGSGPMDTHLLDPDFPQRLARYAGQVAAAFPHIRDYTPVNELFTTVCFSALYGHWYPHARDTGAFLRALLHECRATQLAMREIRRVRADARLIQTEDIASVRSTPLLRYQAEYENERRFLGFDLLCGRVDRSHPLYEHLRQHGIDDGMLAPFLDDPCPPDLIGVNYYLTSDRFLDEELDPYPAWSHGGNGLHRYADIDAGHVPGLGLMGHERVLRGVWERYRLPLALTEVHIGCTREEQLRWYDEAWRAACSLRAEGVAVEAVTSWALLGSYDWSSLVCTDAGIYETGAFDLRAAAPRETAVAGMLSSLALSGRYEHPVLESAGWWHRRAAPSPTPLPRGRPILITGAGGRLGAALVQACEARGLAYVALGRLELDVTRHASVRDALRTYRPWAVINAAGTPDLEHCERDPLYTRSVHGQAPIFMAEACKAAGVRLLSFSSAEVFDGEGWAPYLETDAVQPRSRYGQSQADAERCLLELNREALVVRTSMLFGGADGRDPLQCTLRTLARPDADLSTLSHAIGSPTLLPHLVHTCLDLLIDGVHGRWHLANAGEESWAGLLRRVARALALDALEATLVLQQSTDARAAAYRALGCMHGAFMPPLDVAFDVYMRESQSLRALASTGVLRGRCASQLMTA